ncbi:glycoside hydrolase family 26 protein [Pseudarthrobacter sp. YAF2]|uniref:glycoside hydrolase family 26 protein n=1 Tax=Pseudarthrobacter sp. YAF2 TaxID=3233078 RepID=UPI003F9B1671
MPDHQSTDNSLTRREALADRFKSWALPVAVAVLAVGFGVASITTGLADRNRAAQDQSTAAEADQAQPVCEVADRASLAPSSGTLFGVNLDPAAKPLAQYATELGHKPAVSVSFVDFPYTDQDRTNLQQAAAQIRKDGHMMLLTLEPQKGLSAVTPDAIEGLVKDLVSINGQGVPVVVRFAHEMNGFWFPWSQQPVEFRAAFTQVADAVHAGAPGSAMMWAPSYAGGYAYPGRVYDVQPGTPDFTALDTSDDGALNMADDPYAPFYPGDAAVDWVGLSLFHWGATYPWGANAVPEPNKFADQLTGNYNGTNGDERLLPDFYTEYAVNHGKPLAIPGTAALYNPAAGGPAEADIKRAWWEQVFSARTHAQFPNLKMINWFEWDKDEAEVKGRVDWTVTSTPAIRDAFTAALPDWLKYGAGTNCRPAGS